MIRVGQWLCGDGFTQWEHAVICIDRDGRIVEAEASGARVSNLAEYDDGRPLLWSAGRITLSHAERTRIVAAAISYIGTPYSFIDYAAIGLHTRGVIKDALRRYIAATCHQSAPNWRTGVTSMQESICSQTDGSQVM